MSKATSPTQPVSRPVPDALYGMDELNLAEFPLSFLGERPEGVKTLEFCDTVFDSSAGQEVTRKLTVTGSELYGLPSHIDDDVLVVMMHLTNLLKFESRTVHFSRYNLVELLGWSHGGHSYERLEQSLRRWLGVTLYYENAWWSRKTGKWVDQNFHILSNVTVHDRRGRASQSELPLSSFTWNEVVFDSFRARNTKALDLNDYFGLKLAPAKRMYRFLDKRFGARRGNVWRFDLREFACEHIGFARGYDSAQLKRKMKPSLTELEEHGFLKPMAEAERYPKGARRGEHFIVVEKVAARECEPPPREQSAESPPAVSPLEADLVARKVSAKVARELITQFAAADISARIDVLDWLVAANDKRVGRSPAGYLVKSIRDGFEPPGGYVPKAEREQAQQTSAARQHKRQQEAQAKAVAEKREEEARRAEREHIERHLAALSPADREALEERALAAATPGERDGLTNGFLTGVLQRLLIDRQVLRERPLAVKPNGAVNLNATN